MGVGVVGGCVGWVCGGRVCGVVCVMWCGAVVERWQVGQCGAGGRRSGGKICLLKN